MNSLLVELWMLKTLLVRDKKKVKSTVEKTYCFRQYLNHKQNICKNMDIEGTAGEGLEVRNILLETEEGGVFVI